MSDAAPDDFPRQRLDVRLNGVCCGGLWQERGQMAFAYHPDWLRQARPWAISQSLPLRADPHEGAVVEAYFANLLPEGDVLAAISRVLKVSQSNHYGLLEEIGGDCAGALSLDIPGRPQAETDQVSEVLDRADLARMIEGLPARPLLVGETGVRLSLAGAQPKLALCKSGDDWIKPAAGKVSTHILKPPIRDFAASVENELFCMKLAARCGLGVPDCWIENDPKVYVVERYDRRRNAVSGKLERLHQEDFCQALGLPSTRKYQNEGGPGFKACFDLVRRVCSDPLGDLQRLLRWAIFNVLIGNHDAHAKNLSLLYVDGKVRLAPYYDLICTAADMRLDEKFAMRIGGAKSARYLTMRNWDEFAEDVGMKPRFVREEISTLTKAAVSGIKVLMHEISIEAPGTFINVDVVLDRVKLLDRLRVADLGSKTPAVIALDPDTK